MQIEYIALQDIFTNDGQGDLPTNPRYIKDEKFNKLILSVLMFPRMLELRPIVINADNVILGGNMRFSALNEIATYSLSIIKNKICRREKFKTKPEEERKAIMAYWCEFLKEPKAPVVRADKLSLEEQKEFIIKDNSGFGEWDWDILADEWDSSLLDEWGVDLWQPEEQEGETEQTAKDSEESDTNNEADDEDAKEDEKTDFFQMMLGDRLYDSNNEFDIPSLLIEKQPKSGVLLPFSAWGTDSRQKKGIATYCFYVDDYRFEALWKDPMKLCLTGCTDVVEPNLSLFDTTPVAYGLQQIYKKRWISRYWQECGINVYVDLNVSQKFIEYNQLGIPRGYNAFATRGYDDRVEALEKELQVAKYISGKDNPNMLVYGGGKRVKEFCLKNNLVYVEQYMNSK